MGWVKAQRVWGMPKAGHVDCEKEGSATRENPGCGTTARRIKEPPTAGCSFLCGFALLATGDSEDIVIRWGKTETVVEIMPETCSYHSLRQATDMP